MIKSPPADAPTEHSAIARTLARAIDSYGCSSRIIFSANGLSLSQTEMREARILGRSLQGIWRDAVAATGDSALGITFAEQFHPGSLHGLGFTCAASNTLYDAVQRLIRYFRIISSTGEIQLHETKNEIALVFILPMPTGVVVDATVDGALALLMRLIRFAKGEGFNAKSVTLQHAEPKNTKRFTEFFQCPIVFNSKHDSLVFNRLDLEQALPVANPDLARANDQVVIDYLKKFDIENVASQVSSMIIRALPDGVPLQKDIAAQMNKTTRTLQRNLRSESTSFSKLLEEARHVLAKEYLRQGWHTVGEVSYLLSFTEPSNFARAFKKWTGETPKEYRERRRTSGGE